MSLLKRIGTTDSLPNGGTPQPAGTGQLQRPGGTGPTPGTASPSSVLPRGTGRLGAGDNGRQSMPTGSDNFLDLKNRVRHRLIAELDPRLDLRAPMRLGAKLKRSSTTYSIRRIS